LVIILDVSAKPNDKMHNLVVVLGVLKCNFGCGILAIVDNFSMILHDYANGYLH